jgi:DNA-binding NarL/FixJ family response regulator
MAWRRPDDKHGRGVRVLILTTYETDEYVYNALGSGASGFLVKDTEPEELIHTVRVIARGDGLLSPRSRAGSSPTSRAARSTGPAS